MNILLRLPLIALLTTCTTLPFTLSASPPLAPHLHTPFSGTGLRPYHDRLPWAVKHRAEINWIEEFGKSQDRRRKFFLKGHESLETLTSYKQEQSQRSRGNSKRVEDLIEFGNREVPSWVLRNYR